MKSTEPVVYQNCMIFSKHNSLYFSAVNYWICIQADHGIFITLWAQTFIQAQAAVQEKLALSSEKLASRSHAASHIRLIQVIYYIWCKWTKYERLEWQDTQPDSYKMQFT